MDSESVVGVLDRGREVLCRSVWSGLVWSDLSVGMGSKKKVPR